MSEDIEEKIELELSRLLREDNPFEHILYMTEPMRVEFDKAMKKEAEKYLNIVKNEKTKTT